MKFYLAESTSGETLACELTRKAAIAKACELYKREEFVIRWVDCPVNAETVRRLLGDMGGYATATGGDGD